MIGSTVDKYEVLQKVGEGGMATVYLGRHTTLDREVAIKVLHPHLSSSSRNRKRFAREARAIEQLRHANILEIFDYSGIDCQDCYIITEYVEGQTLTSLVESRGRLPSELVSLIGLELCRALGYAHTEGVLHRDLKPDNVMVRVDGTVKLMDFGIARFLDESQVTLTGALVGSPAFMSPEQALENPLDLRSDLFSLGTMLYYLVTGQLPFTGSNPSLILKKVIEGERPNVSELAPAMSPTLADTVERLMSTHPEGRFDTAAATAEALAASLAEVHVDPTDPAWSIAAYLGDPDGFEERLQAKVGAELLDAGKVHLEAGNALDALRLFNRLLSIDEDNEEVLGLIQALHAEPEPERSRGVMPWGIVGVVGLLLLGSAYAYFVVGPPPSSGQPDPAPTQVAPPPAPAEPSAPATPEPVVSSPTPRPVTLGPARPPSALTERPKTLRTVRRDPAKPPTPEPPPPARGELRLRSRIPAEVFHEGRRIGTTRLPISLDAGSYELELRSDVIQPRRIRVEVGPGEVLQREVTVETLPAVVHLAATFGAACQVVLDGRPLGTVGALENQLSVPNPEQVGHRLEIRCAGAEPFERVWSSVVLPGDVIEP